jgi:hypothetical protein
VSTDGELYERDPEAWNAYLAEGNAKQARLGTWRESAAASTPLITARIGRG